jgi:predicted RND superfamily exporter protein
MVPVIIALASIHLMGVSLNIGTSIVSAICLGIAVDDTIHFMTHFLRYKTLYPNHTQSQAIEHTFQQTGEALSLTTLVLVISFGCFAFANFLPNMHFGILTAIGLIVALGTDLLFLPALLLAFNSKRQ